MQYLHTQRLHSCKKKRGVYAEENAFAICPDMRWPMATHDSGHGICLWFVKSVGSTSVQCVDHLVPLCSGTFSFSVLGVGAEWGSSSLECVCFDHLSRSKWNVTRSG